MGKKSRRWPPKFGKGQTGCMWGLITMFGLRGGLSATKLLSDREHGSGIYFGTKYLKNRRDSLSNVEDRQEVDDVDESIRESINVALTSVQTLMEEEINKIRPSKKIPSEEIDGIRSELCLDIHSEKNYEHKTGNFKVVSNLVNDLRTPICLESQQSNCMNPTEGPSPNFDLDASTTKLYDGNHQAQEQFVDYKSESNTYPDSEAVDCREHNFFDEPNSKLSEKQLMLQKALVDVADVFLSQKLIDTKHASGTVQSQEFMNALEILSTNKELLVGLLQDHQNAQIGQLPHVESNRSDFVEGIDSSGQLEEPINLTLVNEQPGCCVFSKQNSSKAKKSSRGIDSSHSVNKIIVLQPSPSRVPYTSTTISPSSSSRSDYILKCQEDGKRVVSHFSFGGIKRRLKNVISNNRKERDVISMDGILHRIPYGSKDSSGPGKQWDRAGYGLASKTYNSFEYTSQSSWPVQDNKSKPKRRQKNTKDENNFLMARNDKRLNMAAAASPLNRKSFYEEAKEHLAQTLNNRDKYDMLEIREVSKPLGRLLSLAEENISPRFSPRRDKELEISPRHLSQQDNSANHLSPLISDLLEISCTEDNLVVEAKMIDANSELTDTRIEAKICIVEDLNSKGSTEIVDKADIISKEERDWLDAYSKSVGNDLGVTSERCIEEGLPVQSGRASEERSPESPCLLFSLSSLLERNTKNPEGILENPERASPVSVLELLLSEDINITGSEQDIYVESTICPQSTHSEEHDNPTKILALSESEVYPIMCVNDYEGRFRYVRAVLELSGLSCSVTSNRWLSSDQLLDPSLFCEVELSHSLLSGDTKLLFDCINEELVEIQERLFISTPWVSSIKPNVLPIPTGGNLIQEVCRGIERHLRWKSLRTLNQIVKKDMDCGTWMELRSDVQNIVIETGDAILEDLLEEIAEFHMWD